MEGVHDDCPRGDDRVGGMAGLAFFSSGMAGFHFYFGGMAGNHNLAGCGF